MDDKLIKEYLDNLEDTHKARLDKDERYVELCKENKNLKPEGYLIDKSHTIEEYFNKYAKKLESGKLLAFKENELWLMDPKKKYWEIKNGSEFKYFEIPGFTNIFAGASSLLTPMNGIIAALGVTAIVFTSLFGKQQLVKLKAI